MYLFWLYSVIHVKLIATISCTILAGQAVQQYIGKKWQTFSFPSTDTAQPAQSSSGKLFIVPDPNICSFLNSMVNLFKLTKNISFYTLSHFILFIIKENFTTNTTNCGFSLCLLSSHIEQLKLPPLQIFLEMFHYFTN